MPQNRREDCLSPPLEGTWPGEWDPARQDAEMAHNPLKTSFVESFKKALLADKSTPNTIQYFKAAAQSPLNTSSESEQGVRSGVFMRTYGLADVLLKQAYPLMLFSRLPPVPPDDVLDLLVAEFFTRFHSRTAILRSVPRDMFTHPLPAQYLRHAVACLGSTLSGGELDAENLFWSSTLLITGTLEIDNRVARTLDLVAAWVILESYGVLTADPLIWRRTNAVHGYIETASRRLFGDSREPKMQERGSRQTFTPLSDANNLILSYFMMMDVFRAIHFGGPTSLSMHEFSVRLFPSSYELNSLYRGVVFSSSSLPSDLSSDSALLLLTVILAEINTATTVFHPFQELPAVNRNGRTPKKYLNPHLPFSLNNETSQAKTKLNRALDAWHQAYSQIIEPETLVLFYFCKLQLLFPNLQNLPILAGYPPRVARNTTSTMLLYNRIEQDLKTTGTDALEYAWLIIEACNSGNEVAPVWVPIAVFYASLVVWGMITLDGEKRSLGSLKVLAVFKMELEGIKWPCCRVMADVLGSLMKGENNVPLGD